MKFNWGYGILCVLILFFIGLAYMVLTAVSQKNSISLIEENYYEKELVYQQQMEAIQNLNNLKDSLLLVDSVHFIYIKLPSEAQKVDSGFVEFLRPSDKELDIKQNLVIEADGSLRLDKKIFVNGLYRFRINWYSQGVNYAKVKEFIVK